MMHNKKQKHLRMMSPFTNPISDFSNTSNEELMPRPFSTENLRTKFNTIAPKNNISGGSAIKSRNINSLNLSESSQSNTKITSLMEDFNTFRKMFSVPKHKDASQKKRRKKGKIAAVPNFVKQDSNISDDSNDPKRRRNVVCSIIPLNESIQQKKQLPNIDQSINEEPFHSEDLSDKTQSVKKEANKKEKILDTSQIKSNTNFFFVHRKVKNSRQSILADRPLTIFKGVNKKDSSKFFSPAPMSSKNLSFKIDETNNQTKPSKSTRRKLNPISLKKIVKKKKESFKKITFNFQRQNTKGA